MRKTLLRVAAPERPLACSRDRMRGTLLKATAVIGVAGLLVCASAYGLMSSIEGITVSVTANVTPRTLPARGNAPATVTSVIRIKTTNGSLPPALSRIEFNFDKHGTIDTRGLPVCTPAKLAGTTPQLARKRCAGAIVGEGVGKAEVRLPGQAPMQVSSPLTLFNAPPEGGMPSLVAHAYETVPTAQAVLVPISIEPIRHGRYGYRIEIEIPEIADGYGAATLAKAAVGKTWKRGGRTVGYINAHCVGGRLQVYGRLNFADGGLRPGTLSSPCRVVD
jgi:hypothetical protein